MATNFPTSLDNFTNPVSGNTLDSPSHSGQHSDINDAVEAIETKLGVGASSAGSAVAGQVLTISTAGTSAWTTPTVPGLVQIIPSSASVSSGSATVGSKGQVTFSGVGTLRVNGVFNSTYDNYKVLVQIDSFSGNSTGAFSQFGTNGTANAGANYDNNGFYIDTSTPQALNAANNTFIYTATKASATTTGFSFYLDIFNPNLSKVTNFIGQAIEASNRVTGIYGTFDQTTSFTDYVLAAQANNMTGTVSVYGYRN